MCDGVSPLYLEDGTGDASKHQITSRTAHVPSSQKEIFGSKHQSHQGWSALYHSSVFLTVLLGGCCYYAQSTDKERDMERTTAGSSSELTFLLEQALYVRIPCSFTSPRCLTFLLKSTSPSAFRNLTDKGLALCHPRPCLCRHRWRCRVLGSPSWMSHCPLERAGQAQGTHASLNWSWFTAHP